MSDSTNVWGYIDAESLWALMDSEDPEKQQVAERILWTLSPYWNPRVKGSENIPKIGVINVDRSEVDYGGESDIEAAGKQGLRYILYHGSGGGYGPGMFASDGVKVLRAPTTHDKEQVWEQADIERLMRLARGRRSTDVTKIIQQEYPMVALESKMLGIFRDAVIVERWEF